MSTFYVNMQTIDGGSAHGQYLDQIECQGMRHSIDLPVVSVAAGGMRVLRASEHGPVVLFHRPDKASPALREAVLGNHHLGDVEINRVRDVEGQTVSVETIWLANARVDRVDLVTLLEGEAGEPGLELLESFHLAYDEIRWSRRRYEGSVLTGTVEGGWSVSLRSLIT